MPISSIGGLWSVDLWNPKCASHVYKVTVAVDMFGNIAWICPLAPGTPADVLIWDGYGPSRTRGDFFDFEVGGHDGAYKGRVHVILPFIGRKTGILTAWQQSYNDVHEWYRACIEPLFGQLWHWGLFRNIWRGSPNDLRQSVRVLLNSMQFCIRRSVTLLMDHGTMSRLMFGLIKATQPPCKMRERMRQMCVPAVVRSTLPSQLVASAKSIIVMNAQTNCLLAKTY